MSFNLPLKDMTLHDKLSAMEALWDDLLRTPEAVESPSWHKDALAERARHVVEGTSRFTDWETAKANIRNRL